MVSCGVAADLTDISVGRAPEYEVRYRTGKTVYVEALVDGQWAGRYWNADGRSDVSDRPFAEAAFEIELKRDPTAENGVLVSTGWQWVSSSTDRKTYHLVVELSNPTHAIGVKVHTVLDGTAVLKRWLEISNLGAKPVALTGLAPWSGRLWSGDAPVSLGCSSRWHPHGEGAIT